MALLSDCQTDIDIKLVRLRQSYDIGKEKKIVFTIATLLFQQSRVQINVFVCLDRIVFIFVLLSIPEHYF